MSISVKSEQDSVLAIKKLIAARGDITGSYYAVAKKEVKKAGLIITLANKDPRINAIRCAAFRACDFNGVLPTYRGTQALKIDGKGSTIDARGITDRHVFSATGGGPLRLTRLTFIGGLSGICFGLKLLLHLRRVIFCAIRCLFGEFLVLFL